MILDASVAGKWFLLDEDLIDEADALRDALLGERITLAAPPAIWTEVCNGLVRAARRGRIEVADADALADQVRGLARLIEGVVVDAREIVRTALSVGIGAYGAAYLAAARQTESSVITADQGLLERGRAHGYDVVWLGDVTLRDGVLVDTPQGYRG
jgi:predicted nucleic acid-binding protein